MPKSLAIVVMVLEEEVRVEGLESVLATSLEIQCWMLEHILLVSDCHRESSIVIPERYRTIETAEKEPDVDVEMALLQQHSKAAAAADMVDRVVFPLVVEVLLVSGHTD